MVLNHGVGRRVGDRYDRRLLSRHEDSRAIESPYRVVGAIAFGRRDVGDQVARRRVDDVPGRVAVPGGIYRRAVRRYGKAVAALPVVGLLPHHRVGGQAERRQTRARGDVQQTGRNADLDSAHRLRFQARGIIPSRNPLDESIVAAHVEDEDADASIVPHELRPARPVGNRDIQQVPFPRRSRLGQGFPRRGRKNRGTQDDACESPQAHCASPLVFRCRYSELYPKQAPWDNRSGRQRRRKHSDQKNQTVERASSKYVLTRGLTRGLTRVLTLTASCSLIDR